MFRSTVLTDTVKPNFHVTVLIEGCDNDMACLIRASEDRQGLDAIRALHQQLDDDANGAVDLSESNDVSYYQFFITSN